MTDPPTHARTHAAAPKLNRHPVVVHVDLTTRQLVIQATAEQTAAVERALALHGFALVVTSAGLCG